MHLNTTPPKIGQTYVVLGMTCIIRRVHKFGTFDVEAPNGQWYRVTGHCFL